MRRFVVVLAAFVLLASAARAQDPAASVCAPVDPASAAPFGANTNHVGLIDLHFLQAYGATVTYYECLGQRAQLLGTASLDNQGFTSLLGATPWLCGRLERHFAATATLPDGRFVRGLASVRTMSCAHRFSLSAPARVRTGQTATVKLTDKWALGGVNGRLCVTAPDRQRRCRSVALAKSVRFATRTVTATQRGDYRLDLQIDGYHARATVASGVKATPVKRKPVLLATGDSTMQGVESGLADDLDAFDTRSDVHPGTEISNSDWQAIARQQVAADHPAVAVVSIGAAEGFALDGHVCCDAAWQASYTRRVRALMKTYRQGGTARVYYLTVALPSGDRGPIAAVVNQAVIDAAKGLAGVTVLRMDLLFTPHGMFQETIRDGGRDVDVREADGVHLNASGTAIEAREAAKAIRGRPNAIPSG